MQDLIDFLQINSALMLANPIAFATFAVLFWRWRLPGRALLFDGAHRKSGKPHRQAG